MTDELAVHDITFGETPVIPPLGAPYRVKIVRYMIGSHGPFQDEYAASDYTPDKATAGIAARVQEIRTVLARAKQGY